MHCVLDRLYVVFSISPQAVEISYCDRDPLAYDLTIRLSRDGIRLVFDSFSQRLKIIEIKFSD